MTNNYQQQAINETMDWFQRCVIGLNLCPFAKPVLVNNKLRMTTCDFRKKQDILMAIETELTALTQTDDNVVNTSLLIFTQALKEFFNYLDTVDQAQQLLTMMGLEGEWQIASFHPDYLFEGEPPDAISHYTNRSPFPMLHFIRERHLAELLAQYPEADNVPANNIARLNQLTPQQQLFYFGIGNDKT